MLNLRYSFPCCNFTHEKQIWRPTFLMVTLLVSSWVSFRHKMFYFAHYFLSAKSGTLYCASCRTKNALGRRSSSQTSLIIRLDQCVVVIGQWEGIWDSEEQHLQLSFIASHNREWPQCYRWWLEKHFMLPIVAPWHWMLRLGDRYWPGTFIIATVGAPWLERLSKSYRHGLCSTFIDATGVPWFEMVSNSKHWSGTTFIATIEAPQFDVVWECVWCWSDTPHIASQCVFVS